MRVCVIGVSTPGFSFLSVFWGVSWRSSFVFRTFCFVLVSVLCVSVVVIGRGRCKRSGK